jgi:hypothetical protein
MTEPALVRGVRGAQRGVGGGVGAVRERRERLAGQRLRDVGGGQVVRRLVARGEQRVQVRVGPVVGQAVGPAQAAAAGEQGTGDLVGGCGVEPLQAGRGRRRALLLGEAWETVRRQRGSSAVEGGGVNVVRVVPLTLSRGVGRCPTDARISPARESFGMCGGRFGVAGAGLVRWSGPRWKVRTVMRMVIVCRGVVSRGRAGTSGRTRTDRLWVRTVLSLLDPSGYGHSMYRHGPFRTGAAAARWGRARCRCGPPRRGRLRGRESIGVGGVSGVAGAGGAGGAGGVTGVGGVTGAARGRSFSPGRQLSARPACEDEAVQAEAGGWGRQPPGTGRVGAAGARNAGDRSAGRGVRR